MKVAYIGIKPAYPKVDGGCFASAAFLQNLIDANLEVNYFTLGTEKHPFNIDAFPNNIKQSVRVTGLNISTQLNVFQAVKYLFISGSYNVERFYSSEFGDILNKSIVQEDFDAVIFDNVFAARYLNIFKNNKTTCFIRSHNVEFEIWNSLAKSERNPLKRWYLKKLCRDLKKFELDAIRHSNGVMTLSTDDQTKFQSLGVKTPFATIPVSMSVPEYEHDYSNNTFFHFGAMNWEPNIRAADNAISLWQKVIEHQSNCSLTIAGSHSEAYFQNKEIKGVDCSGFVDSIESFFEKQGILISLIYSGSGVRIKVLEAMSYGIPTITTPLGAKGISDHGAIRIVESEEETLNAIYELHTDENKRKELGLKAKSIINLHHNPKTISEKILEFIGKA